MVILMLLSIIYVIKTADWIIDLGPEGGDQGGEIIATGTPEEVARIETSHTGRYLRKILGGRPVVLSEKKSPNGRKKGKQKAAQKSIDTAETTDLGVT